ncbi:MAG TPA: hypothetical protein VGM82_17990 [Gemmatimonadaceae bacterium]|jgi:hypothetical protein
MRTRVTVVTAGIAAALLSVAATRPGTPSIVHHGIGAKMQSVSALAIGPNGVLYAADPQAATIFALDLSKLSSATPGTKDVANIDQQIASVLGTAASELTISDLKVEPKSHNSFVAVTRGQGPNAQAVLMRIDGAGKLDVVSLDNVAFSSLALPNAPDVSANGRGNRSQSITNLQYLNGRVYVAGLSNEEFASKLWAVGYPFKDADRGTSVEIFHGSHGRLETRSPVYTFLPMTVNGEQDLIAAYLCTPLVRFAVSSLSAGQKIRGTTIAELGAGNRPIDMVKYTKDGNDYLLMSNTSRGVMKIPTKDFGTDKAITTPIEGTAGIGYETIASMTGVQQLDLLDATHAVIVAKTPSGMNLQAVALP